MTKQEYIKQVVGNLQCSRGKKEEIRRQLDSDIEIALGEGRGLEEILTAMGEPRALAAEFNENTEGPGTGKKKNRRRLLIILAAVSAVLAVTAAFLYWFLPKGRDIGRSGIFDAVQVQAAAEEIITLFSRDDYEAIEGYMSAKMREAMEKTSFPEVKELFSENWGELRSIGTPYMVEIRERGKSYVILQVNASYDNVGVTFTITFNEKMELDGFYMR